MRIAVVDHSTLVDDAQAQAAVAAIQEQLQQDVNPAWDLQAECIYVNAKAAGPVDLGADVHLMVLADDADVQDALGYHTVDKHGRPVGFVFVRTTQKASEDWRTTLSHEVLELAVDPRIFLTAVHVVPGKPHHRGSVEIWPVEACDAVQGNSYQRQGVPVSNFVLPAFFADGAPGPYDHLGVLKAPFTLAPGGYSAVLHGTSWTQIFGQHAPVQAKRKPAWHSRRGRRGVTA